MKGAVGTLRVIVGKQVGYTLIVYSHKIGREEIPDLESKVMSKHPALATGKVAVITGGGHGIGFALARVLRAALNRLFDGEADAHRHQLLRRATTYLVLGLFTRFWAFSLLIVTWVAILGVHWPDSYSSLSELWKGYAITNDGFGNYRIPLLFMAMLFPLVFMGAGKLSVDRILAKRFR